MTESAGAASARPRSPGRAMPLPHNPVVARGPGALAQDPGSGFDLMPLGAEMVPYAIRLHGVEAESAEAFQRVLGVTGASARLIERGDGSDVWIVANRQQLEAARTQLLAAPSALLRLAEEVAAALRAYHCEQFTLQCGSHRLECGPRPLIMGIVNCTPDSFFADSTAMGSAAIARAEAMVQEGADIVDVGGESTRPGGEPVDADTEITRVVPVIRALSASLSVPVSVDTTKASVARAAIDAGATLVNDISGLLYDRELGAVIAAAGVPVVLMHMRGRPQEMYRQAVYHDVVAEVVGELRQAVARAVDAGVDPEAIIVDPGIGFAKRTEHSLTLLGRLSELRSLGRPIALGPSRKSFIGGVLDLPVEERLEGTAAAIAIAVHGGAHILRVHDVMAMRRVADMAAAIRSDSVGSGVTRHF